MKDRKEKTHKTFRVITLTYSFVIFSILLFTAYYIYSKLAVTAYNLRITNITSTSATISWTTNRKDNGFVIYGLNDSFDGDIVESYTASNKGFDERDILNYQKESINNLNDTHPTKQDKYYSHFVTLRNLEPNARYYFRLTNGLKTWDKSKIVNKEKWYDIDLATDTSFKTLEYSPKNVKSPDPAYGSIETPSQTPLTDTIVHLQAYKTDDSGVVDNLTESNIISTLVNEDGGWSIDKNLLYSNDNIKYEKGKDVIYVYTQIKNDTSVPGRFLILETEDSPDYYNYSSSSDYYSSNKGVSKVFAGNPEGTLCCVLTISGRKKPIYDFENGKANGGGIDSCEEGFPVGRSVYGGTVESVKEYRNIEGSSLSEQRNNCENLQNLSGAETGNKTTPKFANNVCSTNLDDSKFKVSNIDREKFSQYATLLAGEGHFAKECFNYVACKAQEGGFDPAFVLNIWMHESGASNYVRFPGVEDMGIHCYGGNSEYPAYACNTTPKEDLTTQLGMFIALPHTMCLTGGFDLAKWAAGFWTGSDCDMSKGNQYVKDLESQWLFYGSGSMPNGVKSGKTKDLNCDEGFESNGETSDSGSNSSSSSSSSTSNSSSGSSATQNTTNSSTNTQANTTSTGKCCAVILDGESQFRLTPISPSDNCSNKFQVGTSYNLGGITKKIQYVTQTTDSALSCTGNTAVQCIGGGLAQPEGKTLSGDPSGFPPQCVNPNSEYSDDGYIDLPLIKNVSINDKGEDLEATMCCQVIVSGKKKPIFDFEKGKANGGGVDSCEEGFPIGRKIGDGQVTSVTEVPVSGETIDQQRANCESKQSSISRVFAADDLISIDNSTNSFSFKSDGVYDITMGGNKIENFPVNKVAKYRLYEEKNGSLGYQDGSDKTISISNDLTVVKKGSAQRNSLLKGINLISFNFTPQFENKPIMASQLLYYKNIDGVRITHITKYEGDFWNGGVKPKDDGSEGYIGTDFPSTAGTGYAIIANSELKSANTLDIPGNKLDAPVELNLITGFNLIGINGTSTSYTGISVLKKLSEIKDLTPKSITQWNSKTGKYDTINKDGKEFYGTDYKIKNTQGYFIKISKGTSKWKP